MKAKLKSVHPFQWIVEDLENDPTFIQRKMFGAEVIFLNGRQVLALIAGDEPWNGLLVCTSREFHASLMKGYPALKSHAVLGKWLYISQADAEFEEVALTVRDLARTGDPRIGIEPKARKKRKAK